VSIIPTIPTISTKYLKYGYQTISGHNKSHRPGDGGQIQKTGVGPETRSSYRYGCPLTWPSRKEPLRRSTLTLARRVRSSSSISFRFSWNENDVRMMFCAEKGGGIGDAEVIQSGI